MTRRILNTPISTRLLFLCLIPILALTAVGAMKLLEERQRVSEARFVTEAVNLVPALSNLVHELQKERGMSAGFIASKGKNFADTIGTQREDTDGKLAEFQTAIANIHPRLQIPAFSEPLEKARDALTQLQDRRGGVDGFQLTVPQMAGYYTPLIASLLATVESVTTVIDDASVLRLVLAYNGLIEGKERAGVERAMGAAGFGSGTFSEGVHRNFIRLGAMQDTFFARFRQYADPADLAAFESALSGPVQQDVLDLRKLAHGAPFGADISGVTGPQWFGISTKRIDVLKTLEDSAINRIASVSEAVAASASREFWILLGFLVALQVLSATICYLVAQSIAPPIKRLASTMRELAANNVDITVPDVAREDEIGRMAKAVAVFKDNAIERIAVEHRAQDERGTERARQAYIEGIVEKFRAIIASSTGAVSNQADGMRGAAARLSGIARDASANAESADSASAAASENVQSVATASEQLSTSIQKIASQTGRVNTLMEEAANRADQTNAEVSALSESADRIGTVVNLISDIAEQTNLLALNATIEAARAGEAGRGFAVVASEVKELATQTAKATEDIGQQITGIQNSTSGTVEAIGTIATAIKDIRELTSEIADAVEAQHSATADIAHSVGAASNGTSQVASDVASVSDSITVTAGEADTVNLTADELTETTNGLIRDIEAFLQDVTKDVQDRRAALRVKMSEVVVICPEGRRRQANILDASTSGAQISAVDGLDIGSSVNLELSNGKTIAATIERFAEDGFGVTFDTPLEDVAELMMREEESQQAA